MKCPCEKIKKLEKELAEWKYELAYFSAEEAEETPTPKSVAKFFTNLMIRKAQK